MIKFFNILFFIFVYIWYVYLGGFLRKLRFIKFLIKRKYLGFYNIDNKECNSFYIFCGFINDDIILKILCWGYLFLWLD